MPLVVVGSGVGEQRLRALARTVRVPVDFVIAPSRIELRSLYRGAQMVLFPALEDFGLVPVEAQACGTPVVGLAAGGSVDTVVDGKTGFLAPEQTVDAFTAVTCRTLAEMSGRTGTEEACRSHAVQFSEERFRERFGVWVDSNV